MNPAYSPEVIAGLDDYIASIAPGGPDIPTVGIAGTDLAVGGEVFRLQCAACHGWAGVGGALHQRGAPSLYQSTPTQVAEAVRIGPGQMPALGLPAISDGQLADLVAYVRYLDRRNNPGGQPLWYLGSVVGGGITIVLAMGLLLVISRWMVGRT